MQLDHFERDWATAQEKYADFRERRIDWPTFEAFMAMRENDLEAIVKSISEEFPNSKELKSLTDSARKKYGTYHKKGKDMAGQQMREWSTIFDDINSSTQAVAQALRGTLVGTGKTSDVPEPKQKIVAPQYGNAEDHAAQQEEMDGKEEANMPQTEKTNIEKAWDMLADDVANSDALSKETRLVVEQNILDANAQIHIIRARLLTLGLTKDQKAEFVALKEQADSSVANVRGVLATEKSAQALSDLFDELADKMQRLSAFNESFPYAVQQEPTVDSTKLQVVDTANAPESAADAPSDDVVVPEPVKKPRASSKNDAVEPAELKATEDPAVLKYFEEEYYSLRDTNKLARGADGHAMGPDEYVASKIAELEALTPAGEAINIPDATQKEVLTALQKSITAERARLEQAATSGDEPDAGTDEERLVTLREKLTGVAPSEDAPKLSATQLYEIRAQGIAEKNGMGDHFKEVRSIRQAYIEARAGQGKAVPKEKVAELKLAYDRALFGWNTELSSKAGRLTGLDRAELLIVSKRDTILGPAHADAEARERALTEKGKTAFGKVQNWAAKTPMALLKGLNWAPTQIGKGIAGVFNKNAYQPNKKMSPEKLREIAKMTPEQREVLSDVAQQDAARYYARAVRIVAGAGIATLVSVAFTPAAGVLLPFVVFTARGVFGTAMGMGGAAVGGFGFDFFNKDRRAKLKNFTSATPIDLEVYQAQQRAYQQNNSRRRSSEKMGTQMLSAVLVGGGTGILSSGLPHSILEQFGGLSSVKEAAKTVADVNAHSPAAGPEAMRVGAAAKAASEHQAPVSAPAATGVPEAVVAPKVPEVVTTPGAAAPAGPSVAGAITKAAEAAPVRVAVPTAPEGLLTSVSIKPGEGFGQLLVDLRQQVAGLENPPAGLKHFLEQNPNALTHRLGVAEDGASLRMHEGDKLFIDAKQNVFFQAAGQERPTLLFEKVAVSPDAPDGYKIANVDVDRLGKMQADAVQRPTATARVSAEPPAGRVVSDAPSVPRAAVVPTEDPSAALNRGQAGGRVIDAATATPDAVPVRPSTDVPLEDVAATGDTQAPTPPPEQPVPASDVVPEKTTPTTGVSEQSTVSASTPAETVAPELVPYINANQVSIEPAAPHLYTAPDEFAPGGRQLIVYGGGNASDQGFMSRVQQLAREHPGEKIYFEAGEPTMYNGIPQKWITSAVFDPRSGFRIGITPESPEMIGRIDPQSFNSKLN